MNRQLLVAGLSAIFLAGCAGGGGTPTNRETRNRPEPTGGPKVDLSGVKGDVELLMPKEITSGEILLPIDHSARPYAVKKHREALGSLQSDLERAGFRESSIEDLKAAFPVGDMKIGGEGVHESFLLGTFRESRPFVTHLRHVTTEDQSRFTVSVMWTTGVNGAETALQREKVGDFCEDVGIWWLRNDPFRLR